MFTSRTLTVLLHSMEDGRLLALLDSSSLTALRTAVSGAVGADTLARKNASSVAIIGCGAYLREGRYFVICSQCRGCASCPKSSSSKVKVTRYD